MRTRLRTAAGGLVCAIAGALAIATTGAGATTPTPTIMFVTQVPFGSDFASVNAVFGNHDPYTGSCPRGGDLYIRYGDGTLRNLTAEAGYGLAAGQEIAVREPSVHWSGTKALFSMVIGGTTQNDYSPVYWQIYEVSGIGQGQTVQIHRLPQQADANNVSPLYGTDDRILFTSDRTRSGSRATYPQLDEYESQPTVTGIWSMNADGTDVKLLDHAVSGDFTPIITTDGRLVFTRWDHLQRDQQNDEGNETYGAFNYASESSATNTGATDEIFPELRTVSAGSYNHGFTINQFFPWQMNEDGTALETLNHVGRHELLGYFDSANDDLPEFIAPQGRRTSSSLLHLKEDPTRPGYFYGTRAPEFQTHAAGQIVGLDGHAGLNADQMQVDYVTDPNTADPIPLGQPVPQGYAGHFRNPTPLSDGTLVAVRTTSAFPDATTGGVLSSRYDFYLVRMQLGAGYAAPGARLLASPIVKSVSYWDNQPFQQVSYSGPMWELDPVEVRARTVPARHVDPLPSIEQQILLDELGSQSNIDKLTSWLSSHRLALITSRNVTRRADRQQPYNLRIPGGTQTAEGGATPADLLYAQFFQGDLVRGYAQINEGGRRPIARVMHGAPLPFVANAPAGGVQLGLDGSMAAFVPARRALTWQVSAPNGASVIRERYWVTFAPGEIRSCTNCHGVNTTDTVLGQPPPSNPPQAFRDLVRWWRDNSATGTVGDTVGVVAGGTSTFFLRNTHAPGGADVAFGYGPPGAGWVPLSGDWDGDGTDTPGWYAPSSGTFFLKNSNAPGAADLVFGFGPVGGVVPIVGDWDGDGIDTVGVYVTATATFFLRNFHAPGAADIAFQYGPTGATPLAGDWDGDGTDTIAIYVPATGAFFLRNANAGGAADVVFVYGPAGAGWKPLAGDWNANGVDSVGLYAPTTGTFFLKNTNASGAADLTYSFGPAGGVTPLVGNWNGA